MPFTTFTTTHGVKVLEFAATNKTEVPYIIDFCGLEEACERFIARTKREPLKPHFVINGLIKSGKSTVLTRVLPAVVRRHHPDALFWEYEVDPVSGVLLFFALVGCRMYVCVSVCTLLLGKCVCSCVLALSCVHFLAQSLVQQSLLLCTSLTAPLCCSSITACISRAGANTQGGAN